MVAAHTRTEGESEVAISGGEKEDSRVEGEEIP